MYIYIYIYQMSSVGRCRWSRQQRARSSEGCSAAWFGLRLVSFHLQIPRAHRRFLRKLTCDYIYIYAYIYIQICKYIVSIRVYKYMYVFCFFNLETPRARRILCVFEAMPLMIWRVCTLNVGTCFVMTWSVLQCVAVCCSVLRSEFVLEAMPLVTWSRTWVCTLIVDTCFNVRICSVLQRVV